MSGYNQRVTIVTPGALTPDGMGGFIQGESFKKTIWGDASQIKQFEKQLFGLSVGSAAFKFKFRYHSVINLSQQNKLEYEGKTFRIIEVNEIDELKKEVQVIANEQTN